MRLQEGYLDVLIIFRIRHIHNIAFDWFPEEFFSGFEAAAIHAVVSVPLSELHAKTHKDYRQRHREFPLPG